MTRFRLTFILIAFAILYSGIAVPEDHDASKGGTIHGYITDTTPTQLPIVGVRVQIDKGISKEQKSFSEKYGQTIQEALFTTIISGILGSFFLRFSGFLNKRRRKYELLWNLRTDRHKQFLNKRQRKYNQE